MYRDDRRYRVQKTNTYDRILLAGVSNLIKSKICDGFECNRISEYPKVII